MMKSEKFLQKIFINWKLPNIIIEELKSMKLKQAENLSMA